VLIGTVDLVPVHVNLTVADVDISVGFYQRWLGFGGEDRRFPDGTVFVRDAEGTDLAFHQGDHPASETPGLGTPLGLLLHFGFRRREPSEVRELHAGLVGAGVGVVGFDDEAEVVSVKFADPDGYLVEVYWETDTERPESAPAP